MSSLNSIFNIGASALSNAQVGISVTSNNLANADVTGYSRQTVQYTTGPTVSSGSYTYGSGAEVAEITRHFSYTVESQYLSYSSDASMWETITSALSSIETLFDDSDDEGYDLSTALDAFWTSLDALAADPESEAARTELTGYAETLTALINSTSDSLEAVQTSLNTQIEQQVDDINDLLNTLADLNSQLASDPENATLLDSQATTLRDLATYLDLSVVYNSDGQVTVYTGEGQTLVQGGNTCKLAYEGPQATQSLTSASTFDGQIYFEGESSHEIALEFVTSGSADGTASAATYKVSLDGGKTWLTDDSGNALLFTASGADDKVTVAGVSIWFGSATDSGAAAGGTLAVGDDFAVMAKSGVYWYQTTSGKVNVTPVDVTASGSNNRLSGGSLAGLLATRDQYVGSYLETLDALAEELAWQVNYVHSQGAGLTGFSSVTAENSTGSATTPLADSSLAYADRLGSGTLSISVYDDDTGEVSTLSSIAIDPASDSLQDVADTINTTFSGQLTASINNGQLTIAATDGMSFQFAGDTSGLLAALGINTFFSGSDAGTITVSDSVLNDPNRVNAGVVDASGEALSGDSTCANNLAALADTKVTLNIGSGSVSKTLSKQLAALASTVGTDVDTSARKYTYYSTLADNADDMQQSISGVSTEEELLNLTKYQQSYSIAAQLIQVANSMFDTILSLRD
ncbi:flagellar hook-associated protein FlgK [Nitratidesulfovibrio sp. SRB-5]|uniref:flagellar hook-associated protein FlgK n=1 Tax=Nitratidesulfovibrio sp. SRB-5 TaxID=2872636 RepID=UPI001027B2D1|nr:flagellar hook-associated protein FlgK [Nitratidesulfovibrio sp. SRB-5]MBZ2172225.1 flagellar hook-associated protein FlgK [Nitratidesulfovibrio sp. SRB-5]RXF76090.1 flagellar hook-associated protein FlgK [Desulfovibrio sp. DS-1]